MHACVRASVEGCVRECDTKNNFDSDPGRHVFITVVSFKPFSSSSTAYSLSPEERMCIASIKKIAEKRITQKKQSTRKTQIQEK